MKISALAATLLIATTAHAAEKKQNIRKAESEADKLAEAIEVRYNTSCSICYIMMRILCYVIVMCFITISFISSIISLLTSMSYLS